MNHSHPHATDNGCRPIGLLIAEWETRVAAERVASRKRHPTGRKPVEQPRLF